MRQGKVHRGELYGREEGLRDRFLKRCTRILALSDVGTHQTKLRSIARESRRLRNPCEPANEQELRYLQPNVVPSAVAHGRDAPVEWHSARSRVFADCVLSIKRLTSQNCPFLSRNGPVGAKNTHTD